MGHIVVKGLWTLQNKIFVEGWLIVLLNLIFASIAYMEEFFLFNFIILVLTNLLVVGLDLC